MDAYIVSRLRRKISFSNVEATWLTEKKVALKLHNVKECNLQAHIVIM